MVRPALLAFCFFILPLSVSANSHTCYWTDPASGVHYDLSGLSNSGSEHNR